MPSVLFHWFLGIPCFFLTTKEKKALLLLYAISNNSGLWSCQLWHRLSQDHGEMQWVVSGGGSLNTYLILIKINECSVSLLSKDFYSFPSLFPTSTWLRDCQDQWSNFSSTFFFHHCPHSALRKWVNNVKSGWIKFI